MPQYITNVQAINATAGTEAVQLALTVATGEKIKIVRIRMSALEVSSVDAILVKFLRTSTLGSGSTSGTAVKKDPLAPASQTTVDKKNGSTGWAAGTIIDTVDEIAWNGRSMIEWQPIDESDYIIVADNQIFELTANCSTTANHDLCSTIEWIET